MEDDFKTFVKEELKYIRGRVDKLWDWRMLLIGGSLAIGAIVSTIVSLVFAYIGAR
jgi:hypothetical protein